MDEHDEKRAQRGATRTAAWGRAILYAAIGAAVLSCGRSEPPVPSPPDAPPKPKVTHISAVRAGMQPAIFSYTGRTRLPNGYGVLPGPASEKTLTI
jgi:hypothetical protein